MSGSPFFGRLNHMGWQIVLGIDCRQTAHRFDGHLPTDLSSDNSYSHLATRKFQNYRIRVCPHGRGITGKFAFSSDNFSRAGQGSTIFEAATIGGAIVKTNGLISITYGARRFPNLMLRCQCVIKTRSYASYQVNIRLTRQSQRSPH